MKRKKFVYIALLTVLIFLVPSAFAAGTYSGGDGLTVATAYQIADAADMQEIGANTDDWDKHFILTGDPDLAGYTGTAFNIIGNNTTKFTGVFDGNDRTISNFTYTSTGTDYIGLFGYVGTDGEIKDLNLMDANVNAGTRIFVGSLAGYSQGSVSALLNYDDNSIPSDLRDISGSGTSVSLYDDEVSGAIALPFDFNFYGTDHSQVYISANGFITFLSGQSDGYYSGEPLPQLGNPDGLIAGFWADLNPYSGGTIRYEVLGSAPNREFVIGFYDVPHFADGYPVTFEIILHEGTNDIELQYGSAPSDGENHSIGIENFNGSDGLQVAYGDVSFNNEGYLIVINGEVETINGGIYNCFASGSVTGNYYLGGLCGINSYGTIINCYSTGSVTGGDSSYVGGLCGYNNEGTLINCYSTGSVTSGAFSYYLGGLCGYNYEGTLINCYSTGTVTGGENFSRLGGLCGENHHGTISNCYSTGSVTGDEDVGGLCGYNSNGTISNCYAIGSVDGNSNLGGLCGGNNATITGCFWDIETSGIADPEAGGADTDGMVGMTTVEMQIESTFSDAPAGWDFVSTWWMNVWRDYPKLYWQPFGDLNNDSHVDFDDYAILAGQWYLEDLSGDIAPGNGDGIVNLLDFAALSSYWTGAGEDYNILKVLGEQWLAPSAFSADIAPVPYGDGFVDELDLQALSENWLEGPQF